MKRRWILVGLFLGLPLLLLCGIGSWALSFQLQGYPARRPADLLATPGYAPQQLNGQRLHDIHIRNIGAFGTRGEISSYMRSWKSESEGPGVLQDVYRYKHPITAHWYFDRNGRRRSMGRRSWSTALVTPAIKDERTRRI